jgi:hypothetical protein
MGKVGMGSAIVGGGSVSNKKEELERKQLLKHMSLHPWNWMTAVDLDGRPIVWTKDEIASETRPFPSGKEYLKEVLEAFIREPRLFVQKSRQMYVTSLVLLLSLWEIMNLSAQRVILSKVTEDDAFELIRDKVRFPWSQMPEWLKLEWQVSDKPQGIVLAKKTNSVILAVAENAAERECRGGSASRVIIDEAAFQENTPEIFTASDPMARRINVISTPMIGGRGGNFMRAMIYDEEWKG